MHRRTISNYGNLLLGVSLAGIAGFTLMPHPDQTVASMVTPWFCVVCGAEGLVDVILNIALFVPLGVALGLKGVRPSRALLAGLLLSVAIELLQATLVSGRDPSLSDVLTNTLGALAGAFIGGSAGQLWRPSVAQARQLALAAAVSWLLVVALSAAALTADPAGGSVRLVEAPPAPLSEPFAGTIMRSDVDSSNGLSLAAEVTTAGLTQRLAPILELSDGSALPLARLGQLGQKPTFSRRLIATRVRLQTPTVRVYGGVLPSSPARARIEGGITGPRLWSAVTVDGARHRAQLALTPGLGWMLLLPLGYPFDVYSGWTSAIWLALPLLLVGFWAGRAQLQFLALITGAAVLLAAGLEGSALLFHLARDGIAAWGLGLGAIVGSWVVGRGSWDVGRGT